MVTINSALEDIMQLDFASREILIEILQKRQIEARRDEIAKTAKKSLIEFQSGKNVPLPADDIIAKLNNL